jgi:hypothetical protein
MALVSGNVLSNANVGQIFASYSDLEVKTCPVCGVMYAAPEAMLDWCRKAPHRTFYCPAGHSLHFPGKTEEEKLREQLERERTRAGGLASERDQLQASLRAQKGATTRARKQASKAARGVCPVPGCKRHFVNVERHVETKHPEWAVDHPEAVQPR